MTQQRQAAKFTRLAAAIEFSGEAIISTTLGGTITSWNPAAEKMFGYCADEITGKSDTLLIPQDRTHEVSDIMARVSAGEPVESHETVRIRKNGTMFPVSLTITPIRDSDGTVTGATYTPRDITGQKEAFEAAQHLAAIVQFSADAIISQTLGGYVTSWNPAAEAMFGYTRAQIIGKPIDLLSPEGRTSEITSIRARIKAGRPVEHHETIRVHKDGTPIRVSMTISPIRSPDGTVIGLSTIARNLSEHT